jgi:putative NADPH-quinone reductase
MRGRSARVIVTMGMPALIYRWYYGAHGLKNLKRNILRFVGFAPVRDTVVGSVVTRSRASIKRSLDEIRQLGSTVA